MRKTEVSRMGINFMSVPLKKGVNKITILFELKKNKGRDGYQLSKLLPGIDRGHILISKKA